MKIFKPKFLTKILLATTLMAPAFCTTSLADIIILTSNAPKLKSGQTLPDNASLNIPAGKKVQLILPSGKTKTLKGPFNGNVAAISKGDKSDAGLFKKLMDVVKKSGRDDSGFAAVRRVGRPTSSGQDIFSWTAIPADATGTYCVAEGEQLELLRPRNISIKMLKLHNPDTAQSATITWNTGQKSVLWPDDLLPKDKSRISFQLANLPERSVNFRVVENEARNINEILRTLYKRGCRKQLETWLHTRLKN